VTIYVQFDRPGYDEVRLWVQANGRNDFNVAPESLAFGQVRRSATSEASVTVTFYGSNASRILEVRSESNYVQPRFTEVRRQDSEVVYQLRARLRSDIPVGKWYTDLWLKTNHPGMPVVRVPLTVDVESALSVSPDAVTMGPIKVGGEADRRVIVRGVKPFKVLAVQGTDAELAVKESTTDARAVHVLTVKIKPGKAGDLHRTVRVQTDLDKEGVIEFQVNARGVVEE
jgi:hypothetical protein